MKSLNLTIITLVLLFCLPAVSRAAGIGVLPFKVISFNSQHKHYSADVAELITTRFNFTSGERVVSYPQIVAALRVLGIPHNAIGIPSIKRLMQYLRIDYIVAGEMVINYEGIIFNSKLLRLKNNSIVIESKSFIRGTNHSKFEIVNSAEKAAKELMQGVFSTRLNQGRKIIQSADYDVMLVLDSTAKMETELKFIARKITKIYSRIQFINPAAKIRIGIVDYKDREDVYRAKIFDFTTDLKKIRKHLYSLRAFGGNHINSVDTAYALYYALVKGSWKSPNRFVYLITGNKPSDVPQNYRFSEIIKKARKMKVVVNILGASGLPLEQRGFYKVMAEYSGGHYHDILYKLSFYLEQKGKTAFIYKHHYLFMLKKPVTDRKWMYQYHFNEVNAQDITLGRIIHSIDKVREFLLKEGFKIAEQRDETTQTIDTDIDYIIENSLKPYLEKQFIRLARVQVSAAGRTFYVYVGNTRALNYMRAHLRRGMTVYIGAAIKPSLSPMGFDMDPLTVLFTTRSQLIARILVESPGELSHLAYYFKESGLFDEKLWFIRARIISIRY